jgi:carboxyl-terminal processing protease
MTAKTRIAVVMFSAAVAFYAIVGGFLFDRSATAKGNQWAQLRIFDEVLLHISKDYVDEPDMERVRVGALRGLAEGLDPYSAYLTPAQAASFKPIEPGLAEASGMVLSKVSGYLYVVSILKGSPAESAGVAAGDFIEYVAKAPSRDMSLYDAESLLAPGQGAAELKLFRRGEAVTVTITPGRATQPSVESRILEPGIGYVQVNSLGEGHAQQVRTAVEQLTAKGAKRLVLDLRNCAYGSFEEGAALADLFLDAGVVGRKLGKGGVETASVTAKPDDTVFRGPLSLVIDRSTAGAAEVAAAAILAGKRADVVGDKSFGAGAELALFRLRDGGALLLTTARFAPPAGKAFMEESITPSTLVERPETTELVVPDEGDDEQPAEPGGAANAPKTAPKPAPPAEDVQLKKALELLRAKQEAAAAHAA